VGGYRLYGPGFDHQLGVKYSNGVKSSPCQIGGANFSLSINPDSRIEDPGFHRKYGKAAQRKLPGQRRGGGFAHNRSCSFTQNVPPFSFI
jgi:hypothetical protein